MICAFETVTKSLTLAPVCVTNVSLGAPAVKADADLNTGVVSATVSIVFASLF